MHRRHDGERERKMSAPSSNGKEFWGKGRSSWESKGKVEMLPQGPTHTQQRMHTGGGGETE